MLNLSVLNESFTSGYNYDVLHIISMISIICGISLIKSKNPIVSALSFTGLFLSVATYLSVLSLYFLDSSHLLVYVGAVSILFLFIFTWVDLEISDIAVTFIFLAIITGITLLAFLFDLLDHKLVSHTSVSCIFFAIYYIATRDIICLQFCVASLVITVFYAIAYDICVTGSCDNLPHVTEVFILLLFIVILSYTVMWKFNSNIYNRIFTLFINLIILLLIFFAVYLHFKYGHDVVYAEEVPYTRTQISAFYTHFNRAMVECIQTGVGFVNIDWTRVITFDHVMSKPHHFYATSPRLLNDLLIYHIGAPNTSHVAAVVYPNNTVLYSPIISAIQNMAGR